jgi:hypothetical protein
MRMLPEAAPPKFFVRQADPIAISDAVVSEVSATASTLPSRPVQMSCQINSV